MKKFFSALSLFALTTGCVQKTPANKIEEISVLTSSDDEISYCMVRNKENKLDTLVFELSGDTLAPHQNGEMNIQKTKNGARVELFVNNTRYVGEGEMLNVVDDIYDHGPQSGIKVSSFAEFADGYFDKPGKPQRGGPKEKQVLTPIFIAQ